MEVYMRKFLLASAATLGMVAGATGAAHAQAAKTPDPGTLVVHLNGLFVYQFADVGSSVNTYNNGSKLNPLTSKLNPLTDAGFLRLYPGFDAMTMGGFEYGVASEIRDEFTNAGQGEQENGTSSIGGGTTNNGAEGLIIRRAYAYLGTKQAGIVRIGQGDGPWTLMQDGVIENFGDGNQWNSDSGIGSLVPGAAHPTWLFSDTGALYTTLKVVYLSPSFAGVNFGLGFEPNSNGIDEGIGQCTVAQSTCEALASAPGGAGNARRKNTLDAMLGYTGEFSGVGIKLSGGYIKSSPIGNSNGSPLETIISPETGSRTIETNYKGLGIATVGGQVSFAGFTVGANAKDGQVNNGYTFLLPGQRNAFDWLVSAEYTAGPVTVGGYYFNNQSAGAHLATNKVGRTEQDNGVSVGANYAVSPNLGLFVTYLYGQRKQYGFDFANSESNTTVGNRMHSQAIGAGAALKW
jgi:hypothetical protein